MQGYRVGPQYANASWYESVDYRVLSRTWVGARLVEKRRPGNTPRYARGYAHLLLDRETLRTWRWPVDAVGLAALSDDHVLFRDRNGRHTLMTREGEVRAQFSLLGVKDSHSFSFFSPDGQTLVISVDGPEQKQVYRMPVTASRPEVFFEAEPREGWRLLTVRADYAGLPPGYGPEAWFDVRYALPRSIRVEVAYVRIAAPDNDETLPNRDGEIHFFSWDDDALPPAPSPTCAGDASPDGRYVAQQRGFALGHKYHGQIPEDTGPWPLVVILDAESCEPIFRVLSAYTYQGFWRAQWLSNSDGFVVGLADGHAVAHAHPEPGLTYLPAVPDASGWVPGPVPGPTGDGRYFAYEFAGVYDAEQGEWKHVDFVSRTDDSEVPWDLTSWGATHDEVHYQTGQWGPLWSWDGWFGGLFTWFLLQPKIEFPPFDDELSFLVARTGSCLELYDPLDADGGVLGCLLDGTRVSLARPPDGVYHPETHFSQTLQLTGSGWVLVRTEAGLEGWVSIDYLDHS